MNKINGSTMTQIEKSNTCLNMASRINALFVEAENEVEFNRQDIADILGTCIRNITGERVTLCFSDTPLSALQLTQIINSTKPQTSLSFTPYKISEDARKYMTKYLAKETPAQGINIQAESKQEQHQEKMNLINDAKGRALNILFHERIAKDRIMAQDSWAKIIIIAVNRLFSGLDASDKYLNAKLDMLVDALCNKYSSVILHDGDFETAKKTVIKRAVIIRKNIDLIFFQLD